MNSARIRRSERRSDDLAFFGWVFCLKILNLKSFPSLLNSLKACKPCDGFFRALRKGFKVWTIFLRVPINLETTGTTGSLQGELEEIEFVRIERIRTFRCADHIDWSLSVKSNGLVIVAAASVFYLDNAFQCPLTDKFWQSFTVFSRPQPFAKQVLWISFEEALKILESLQSLDSKSFWLMLEKPNTMACNSWRASSSPIITKG